MPKAKQPQTASLESKIMYRYKQMCSRRDGWRRIFALLSKYVLMRPIWYGDTSVPWRTPQLSVQGVSDDTTVDTARTSATALGGALWPNTANTFELVARIPPGVDASEYRSEDVKKYCEQATHVSRDVIDSPEAGFHIANGEYLDDQVVMGTSGIYGEENDDDSYPICYHATTIETSVIDEGANGMIDTVYFEHTLTARQVVEKYDYDKCSDRTKALYDAPDKQDTYVKVIQAIEPRPKGKVGAKVQDKPFSSVHMEYDAKHILKVSGMDDMPVFVTRFRHRPGELYGRSLAMDALPTVKELNVLRRAYSLALEKILNPPLGFFSDMLGGASQVDISAGARVPMFSGTGRLPDGQQPIFQLLKINEPQVATQRIQELMAELKVKFLVDKLLDFNNETRMTLGEAEMRGDFRNQALGNIFSRQLIEMYNPLIKWTVKVLYRRGLLGLHPVKDLAKINALKAAGKDAFVIPVVIAALMDAGKFPFQIRFISPAARAMKADSMMGMEKLLNIILTLAKGGVTDAIDNVDTDRFVRIYQDHCGAPLQVIHGEDAMLKSRSTRMKQQQAAMQLQQGEAQASIADKTAGAAKKYSQAGLPGMAQQQAGAGGGQQNAA